VRGDAQATLEELQVFVKRPEKVLNAPANFDTGFHIRRALRATSMLDETADHSGAVNSKADQGGADEKIHLRHDQNIGLENECQAACLLCPIAATHELKLQRSKCSRFDPAGTVPGGQGLSRR
jgi:hypothetical protein